MFSTTDKLGPSHKIWLEAFKRDNNLLLLSEIAVTLPPANLAIETVVSPNKPNPITKTLLPSLIPDFNTASYPR